MQRVITDLFVFAELRLPVDNQGDIRRGAANVQRQHPINPGLSRHPAGPGHTRGRARKQHGHAVALAGLSLHQPTVGLGQQRARRHAQIAQRVLEAAQITSNPRVDIAIQDRRGAAFIFPHNRPNF